MALVDGAAYERAMAQLDAERALADELAVVLAKNHLAKDGSCVWEEDTPLPDVVAVLARYREARA